MQGPVFHFCPLVFSREALEFTVCVTGLCSHETQQRSNIKGASFSFVPFLFSHCVRETSCSDVYEEETQVIKVEDLPTCASACDILVCKLFLYPFLPEQKHKVNINKSRLYVSDGNH